MRVGDSVLILCEVTDADEHTFTMAIHTVVYSHSEKIHEITQCDILIEDSQR